MASHLIYLAAVSHVRKILQDKATNVQATSLLLRSLWLHCHSNDAMETFAKSHKRCFSVHIGPDAIPQNLLVAHCMLAFHESLKYIAMKSLH